MAFHKKFIVGIGMICLLSACSIRHEYKHTIYPLSIEKIPTLNSSNITQPIALINAQDSTSEHYLGAVPMHKFYSSLAVVTEAVITSVKAELLKRNINVINSAQKTLKVSVTDAKLVHGMWVIRSILDFKVETGSGLEKSYHVENATPTNVPRAYNGAAALAVVEIFSDADIIAYLQQK